MISIVIVVHYSSSMMMMIMKLESVTASNKRISMKLMNVFHAGLGVGFKQSETDVVVDRMGRSSMLLLVCVCGTSLEWLQCGHSFSGTVIITIVIIQL